MRRRKAGAARRATANAANRLLIQDAYKDAGFITASPFEFNGDKFGGSPTQIAKKVAFALLDGLVTGDLPLISLPGGGISVVSRSGGADGAKYVDYGIDLAMVLPIGGQSNGGSAEGNNAETGRDEKQVDGPAARGAQDEGQATADSEATPSPEVDLCLGAWFDGKTETANWAIDAAGEDLPASWRKPGLVLYLLRRQCSNDDVSFEPDFAFSSVGINIKGGGNGPLIDFDGYSLGGADLRFSFDWQTKGYGFAARLDRVGFPVAPPAGGAAGGDAVARNLLASGSSETSADPNKSSATNPSFSAQVAYVNLGKDKPKSPVFKLYDPSGQVTDLIWFPIQRRFGPLDVSKIGLRVDVADEYKDNPKLGMVFDGGVSLAALELDLYELEVDVYLHKLNNFAEGYEISLQGLNIAFNSGGVEISGGLRKKAIQDPDDPDKQIVSYDGEAIIKVEEFGISAIGSYAQLDNGDASLFIFGMIDGPIGGPPFFYVTGIAAGFGYNRALKLPAQNEITTFPLVTAMSNPLASGHARPGQAARQHGAVGAAEARAVLAGRGRAVHHLRSHQHERAARRPVRRRFLARTHRHVRAPAGAGRRYAVRLRRARHRGGVRATEGRVPGICHAGRQLLRAYEGSPPDRRLRVLCVVRR